MDPISDYTFDQLHGIAKSQKHFAVLLVQNLFTREQLNGCSVYGGRNRKFGLGKILLEMLRAFIWVLSNGLGDQATGVAELCNSH